MVIKTHMESGGIALNLTSTSALHSGGWSTSRPAALRILGKTAGTHRMGAEILPPLGFDSQTVQVVACRYTDYAIPAHIFSYV